MSNACSEILKFVPLHFLNNHSLTWNGHVCSLCGSFHHFSFYFHAVEVERLHEWFDFIVERWIQQSAIVAPQCTHFVLIELWWSSYLWLLNKNYGQHQLGGNKVMYCSLEMDDVDFEKYTVLMFDVQIKSWCPNRKLMSKYKVFVQNKLAVHNEMRAVWFRCAMIHVNINKNINYTCAIREYWNV